MRSVSVRLEDLKNMVLCLGYVGENEHTRVTFDAMKMYAQYPHASVSLTVQPPEGDAYPAVIERDGDLVLWEVTDSDLINEGSGELQLSFTDGEKVAKTYIGRFRVHRSIVPTGEIPEPLDDFLTRAGAALTAIPETIDEEFEAITAEAETLAPGSQATASFDGETKVLTIGVPEGEKGDPGQDGADGLDGYTPQRGVDYWTPADQASMLQDIATEKADAIAAIENKGTQQVGLVTDEGTTQKAAVQAKGDEVLESIPSDYTNLSNDVSDLKSAIEVISDNLEGKIFWNETAVTLLMQILDKAVYSQDMSAQREALAEELEYVPVTGWTITNVLTGITNSNTATSVSDGASYSATLMATDSSKNVGAITVTMGGTDISLTAVSNNAITIASVTGDIVITCAAVAVETLVPTIANPPDYTTFVYSKNSYAYSFIYEVGSITGGKLTCTFDNTLAYDFNAALYIFDSNGNPYEFTPYKKPENYKFSGEWNPYYVEPGGSSGFPIVSDSFSVNIPTGCKAFVFVRPGLEVHYDGVTITGDTAFRTWAMNGGITVTVEG